MLGGPCYVANNDGQWCRSVAAASNVGRVVNGVQAGSMQAGAAEEAGGTAAQLKPLITRRGEGRPKADTLRGVLMLVGSSRTVQHAGRKPKEGADQPGTGTGGCCAVCSGPGQPAGRCCCRQEGHAACQVRGCQAQGKVA